MGCRHYRQTKTCFKTGSPPRFHPPKFINGRIPLWQVGEDGIDQVACRRSMRQDTPYYSLRGRIIGYPARNGQAYCSVFY